MDFEGLRNKAEKFIDEHEDQIDGGTDKAADAVGKRFGHGEQVDQAAEKLKGLTGDNQPDK